MKTIPLIFVLVIIYGCNTRNVSQDGVSNEVIDSTEVIDVSNAFIQNPIEIEDYLHDIKIIPLETNDMSILSDVDQIVVSKEYVYVKDDYENGGVAIFDINGNFIKRLPQGAAPHEIASAESIYVEPQSGNLFVCDQASYKVIDYSPSGEYINNYYIGKMVGDLAIDNNKFFFVQRSLQNESGFFVFSSTDSLFESFADIYLGKEPFAYMQPKYIEYCGDGFNVMLPWVNTVYCYKQGKMFKKYFVKNINADNVDYSAYEKSFDMTKNLPNGTWLYSGTIMDSQKMNIILFRGMYDQLMQVLRNKKTKDCYTVKITNSIYHYVNCRSVCSYDDNMFCGVLLPEDIKNEEDPDWAWDGSNPHNLISAEDMEKLKAVKPDDNPLVIIYRIDLDRPNKK